MDYQLYPFPGTTSYPADAVNVLGGKGLHLHSMCKLGLPVPPGVVIPTTLCNDYLNKTPVEQEYLTAELASGALSHLPSGALYSVRSGAPVSMPGMMDTVLNVGMSRSTLDHWSEKLGHRTALDCYRRLIQMYANVVHDVPLELFTDILDSVKHKGQTDAGLSEVQLALIVNDYEDLYSNLIGDFPGDVERQINECIGAVFRSWNSPRAIAYRKENNIPNTLGTAVTVQKMVFGNLNDNSGSGVLFTRNPITGEDAMYGEFLPNAQGEDVVAGVRTPLSITEMPGLGAPWDLTYTELGFFANSVDVHYSDMQDMEFTVEDGKLYILQTRTGKRSAAAAFRIVQELVKAKRITKEQALGRVTSDQYYRLMVPRVSPKVTEVPVVTGTPAAGSIATGKAVFSAEAAQNSSDPCILIAMETTPDDFGGMLAAQGILTQTGGATCHAAVVARGMDKTCIVGCTDLVVDSVAGKARIEGATVIEAGDKVTLDGTTGRVWVNVDVPVVAAGITPEAQEVISWAMASLSEPLRVDFNLSDDRPKWKSEISCTLPASEVVEVRLDSIGKGRRNRFAVGYTLAALKKNKDLSGVIVIGARSKGDEDKELLSYFGLTAGDDTEVDTVTVGEQVNVLTQAKWTKELKKRFVLDTSNVVLPKWLHDDLIASGWREIGNLWTVTDLVAAKGPVRVAPELMDKLTGLGTPLTDFMALLQEAGREVAVVPKSKTPGEVLFEVLG